MDLETLVFGGGGDGKVACETLISASGSGGERLDPPSAAEEDPDPDFPAESFQVPIEDEIDWVDVNAVYDRDDSTKGNSNPKSNHSNPKPRSNSQRFSGNLKANGPIIGLPNKIQHSGLISRSTRRPPNGRIFPKKSRSSDGGGKSAVPEFEPSSPKVSCLGKVLSERERERCRKKNFRRSQEDWVEERGAGCWAGFAAIFRYGCGNRAAAAERFEEGSALTSTNIPFAAEGGEAVEPAKPAPGLGGMKRFASGRKAAPACGGLEMEGGGHVAVSGSMDHQDGVWDRRSIGSFEDARRDRDWESAGSTSV